MKKKILSASVITWLGKDRYARLGDGRAAALRDVTSRAPDVPTAAIWLLQKCDVMPTEADADRWAKDTTPAAPVNPPSTDA